MTVNESEWSMIGVALSAGLTSSFLTERGHSLRYELTYFRAELRFEAHDEESGDHEQNDEQREPGSKTKDREGYDSWAPWQVNAEFNLSFDLIHGATLAMTAPIYQTPPELTI
jgi:hypothetical protein